jgi:hypothetical protein
MRQERRKPLLGRQTLDVVVQAATSSVRQL